jgi:hypothetical protein
MGHGRNVCVIYAKNVYLTFFFGMYLIVVTHVCLCVILKKPFEPVCQPVVDGHNDRIISTRGGKIITFILCVMKINSFRCTVELYISGCWVMGNRIADCLDGGGEALWVNIFLLQLYYIFLRLKFCPPPPICQIYVAHLR